MGRRQQQQQHLLQHSSSRLVPLVFFFFLCAVIAAGPWMSLQAEASKKYVLKYFVHIELNGALGASDKFLPALNKTVSADFGSGSLFALNVTKEVSRTSKLVGYSRGYTVETSYLAGIDKAVETAVIEYADAETGHNGTFTVLGIVGNSGANEVAIIGGTGTFRGARGYLIISFAAVSNNATVYSFAHEAHFI